jgi:hypothetical protein
MPLKPFPSGDEALEVPFGGIHVLIIETCVLGRRPL